MGIATGPIRSLNWRRGPGIDPPVLSRYHAQHINITWLELAFRWRALCSVPRAARL